MAEVLVEFTDPVVAEDGTRYVARACGGPMPDGKWQGWIEFLSDDAPPVRSGRETTQPNRKDVEYWATGLTAVYLEGALRRALHPLARPHAREVPPPVFDGPASQADATAPPAEGVLNPFSVYRKGETLLRRRLAALSAWHLENIIRSFHLSDGSAADLATMAPEQLIELIVAAVRESDTKAVR
jgi:hypothetical protein